MAYSIRYDIASSLRDTVYFSGFSPKIEKVKVGEKDAWRVSAPDKIEIDVISPGNIVVKSNGKRKTFNSEYNAKTYIIGQILEV